MTSLQRRKYDLEEEIHTHGMIATAAEVAMCPEEVERELFLLVQAEADLDALQRKHPDVFRI